MFGRQSEKEGVANPRDTQISNRILNGTVIEGQIQSPGDFRIDGVVKGKVNVGGKVVIGEKGIVEGDVTCSNAAIAGKVVGDLAIVEVLNLAATARVDGNIRTRRLVVETGAVFNGQCSMGSGDRLEPAEKQAHVSRPQSV